MYQHNRYPSILPLLRKRPDAAAVIQGSKQYPQITGTVRFYASQYGVFVVAEIQGLPRPTHPCESPIFAFHIHEGMSCTGNETDPFADVKTHYNPHNCPHPYHAGDLPPLFGANGFAFSACLTDRFTLPEIIGRTIIIHSSLDDFTTQPSGNAGVKIACGKIVPMYRA